MSAKNKKKSNKAHILWRYGLISMGFFALAAAILIAMVRTTIIHAHEWNERARKDLERLDTIWPERGDILAADGSILACNLRAYDIKIDLRHESILNMKGGVPYKSLDSLADSLDRYYPRVANFHQLSAQEANKHSWHKKLDEEFAKPPMKRSRSLMLCRKGSIADFERIKGFPFAKRYIKKKGFRNPIYTEARDIRIYPYGKMARRSIGRVNEQGNKNFHGYSGVEHDLDSLLYGKIGQARNVAMTSGLGQWVNTPAVRGFNIMTTFDIDIQEMLEEELTRVCSDVEAEWGTAIIMEVKTGEIKAIANVERFDDGSYGEALNRAVRGFEPGSVMKPISLMIAFEDGLVKSVNEGVDCSPFQRTSDPHAPGWKTMKQVIEMSSNTGIARVIFRGYSAAPEKFYDRLASIGFFEPMHSGISSSVTPSFPRLTEIDSRDGRRHTMTERHLDLARQAYGYNSSIPPIYTLAVYNAIANDGKMVRPHVMRRLISEDIDSMLPIPMIRERICSPATAEKVRICLREPVWGEHGTAQAVRDDRVEIAGKTGTVYPMKSDKGGGYDTSRRRFAFAGFFPYAKPKYSCIALVQGKAGLSANRTSGQVVKGVAVKMFARGMLDNVSTFNGTRTASGPLILPSQDANVHTLAQRLRLSNMHTIKTAPAPARGIVPDVTGYDAPSAVKMMEVAGLNVRLSGHGKVVQQSVAAGSKVQRGATVYITLR